MVLSTCLKNNWKIGNCNWHLTSLQRRAGNLLNQFAVPRLIGSSGQKICGEQEWKCCNLVKSEWLGLLRHFNICRMTLKSALWVLEQMATVDPDSWECSRPRCACCGLGRESSVRRLKVQHCHTWTVGKNKSSPQPPWLWAFVTGL